MSASTSRLAARMTSRHSSSFPASCAKFVTVTSRVFSSYRSAPRTRRLYWTYVRCTNAAVSPVSGAPSCSSDSASWTPVGVTLPSIHRAALSKPPVVTIPRRTAEKTSGSGLAKVASASQSSADGAASTAAAMSCAVA